MPNLNLKLVFMSGMTTNVTFSLNDTLLTGVESFLKLMNL